MICDPKVTFPVSQKHFFVVSSKVSIFHQIQPIHGGTIKAMYVSPGETMDVKFSFHLSRPQLIP